MAQSQIILGTPWVEASISINGKALNGPQSCVVRMAICDFMTRMQKKNALGDDETGRAIAAGYVRSSKAVIELIFNDIENNPPT